MELCSFENISYSSVFILSYFISAKITEKITFQFTFVIDCVITSGPFIDKPRFQADKL